MLGRIRTRHLFAALIAAVPAAGCAGSDLDVVVGTSEVVSVTEPGSTSTSEAPDEVSSTSSEATTTTEPTSTDPAPAEQPASAAFDEFLERWASSAAGFPEMPGLAPSISAADLIADPTIGLDVFVEQVTPQTVIGGIVDPETGTITGLMGLSEPDSQDAIAMIEIIWVGAFGVDDRSTMAELFPMGDVEALQIGEQITGVHRGRSVVMNHVDGADPEDGLFVFTVGAEDLVEDDPSHDSIANVVLGLLVRTA